MPETGNFDFLNFLMGLQASSEEGKEAGLVDGNELDVLFPEQKKDGKSKGDVNDLSILTAMMGTTPNASGLIPQDPTSTEMIQPGTKPGSIGEVSKEDPSLGVLGTNPELSASLGRKSKSEKLTPELEVPLQTGIKDTKELPQRELAVQKYGEMLKASTSPSTIQKGPFNDVISSQPGVINSVSNLLSQASETPVLDKGGKEQLVTEGMSLSAAEGQVTGLALPTAVTHKAEVASPAVTTTVPELFNRVDSLVQQGGGKMTVSLNPPHLGQVEVQVTARGKRVEIEMKSQNSATKALLESHVADLRSSMHSQDLQLSKMEVHVAKEAFQSQMNGQYSAMNGGSNPFQKSTGEFNQGRGSRSMNTGNPEYRTSDVARSTAYSGRQVWGSGKVDLRI